MIIQSTFWWWWLLQGSALFSSYLLFWYVLWRLLSFLPALHFVGTLFLATLRFDCSNFSFRLGILKECQCVGALAGVSLNSFFYVRLVDKVPEKPCNHCLSLLRAWSLAVYETTVCTGKGTIFVCLRVFLLTRCVF